MKNFLRKTACIAALGCVYIGTAGFNVEDFKLSDLANYTKEFEAESVGVCSTSSTKTYEDYRLINAVGSKQYEQIKNHMTVDEETGFLFDEEGFIGVAMAYGFGEIGTRYYVDLDTGITIPVVKVDAKAAEHAANGCSAGGDGSVIEFVIDTEKAMEYFGAGNGLASYGNFNNCKYLNGNIVDIQKVSDTKIQEGIVYEDCVVEKLKSDVSGKEGFMSVIGGYLCK